MEIIRDLNIIKELSISNEEENNSFKEILKNLDPEYLDKLTHTISGAVTREIDCTKCGNCCQNLMINVSEDEIAPAAKKINITEHCFKQNYIEEGSNGMMIINTIPCVFLSENKCTIYNERFSGCREFPHLEAPGIQKRLFTLFMNYPICPIIFNTVESLKSAVYFH